MQTWNLPLGGPPELLQLNVGVHGKQTVETWRNLTFWSLHCYGYRARLRVGEEWYDLAPGVVSILPPEVEIEYRFRGESRHVYAHFRPCEAGIEQRVPPVLEQIPPVLEHIPPVLQQVPVVLQPDRHEFTGMDSALRQVAGSSAREGAERVRAVACVWHVLWQIATLWGRSAAGTDPRLARVQEHIEAHLGEELSASVLAQIADLSTSQLVRLFRRHLGLTPLAYVRQRKADRARHLLLNTTLPLKSIAREIGVPDLQQLNKLSRKLLGVPPSRFRRG